MWDAKQKPGSSLKIGERRAQVRLHCPFLIFMNQDGSNGGLVFNITEAGMAVSSAQPLLGDRFINLRVEFPGPREWIDLTGKIVWVSESKKSAGIEFVGLENEALQRIRNWIASEISSGEFHSEANDVNTPIEERPAFHTESKETPRPSNAPRTSPDTVTEKPFFASTSPANSDVPLDPAETEGARSASSESQKDPTNQKQPLAETRSSVADRRCYRGTRAVLFGYLQMDESNRGFVLDISEGGAAITTAGIFTDDRLRTLNVQLPDVGGWIEAGGQIASKSESEREAGVRFVGLTDEARQQISDWISGQTTTDDLQEQEQSTGISEEQEEKLKITNVPERETPVPVPPAPAEDARKIEEAPLFSATSAASETFAPSRKPHNKPIWPTRAHVQRKASGWHSAQRAFGAFLILAFFSLITWKWILLRNHVRTELPVAVTPTTKAEAHKKPATSAEATTESAPTAQVEPKNPRLPQTEPLLGTSKNESLGNRSLKDPGQRLLSARASARPIPEAASRPAENRLAPEQEKTEFWHFAASLNAHPLENASQTAGSAYPAPPQLEAIIQPANPRPLSTNTSQPASPEGRENSMLPATQPTTPANYTGVVAIVADPYPALRLPDGRSSKKQRQVASLELGHLLSRVEPIYPEEAKQQGIQGMVKLRAIIDRHGAVEKVESVNGPAVLVAAATNAVRHWRYTETLLAGQSVETEENIAVIFRLSDSETPKK